MTVVVVITGDSTADATAKGLCEIARAVADVGVSTGIVAIQTSGRARKFNDIQIAVVVEIERRNGVRCGTRLTLVGNRLHCPDSGLLESDLRDGRVQESGFEAGRGDSFGIAALLEVILPDAGSRLPLCRRAWKRDMND